MPNPSALNLGGSGLNGPEFNPFFREGMGAYGRGSGGAVTPMQAQINMISDALAQFGQVVQQQKMDAMANAALNAGQVPGAPAYTRRALATNPDGSTADQQPEDPGAADFPTQGTAHTGGMDELTMSTTLDKQRRQAAADALKDEILTQEAANMRAGRTRSGGTPAGVRSDQVASAKEMAAAARTLNSAMPKDTDSIEHLAAFAKMHKLDADKLAAATSWKATDDGLTMVGQVPKLDADGNPVTKTPPPLEHPQSEAPPGIGLIDDGYIGTGTSDIFGDSPKAASTEPVPQFESIKVPKTVYDELNARKAAMEAGTPFVREGKGMGLFRPMEQYLKDQQSKPGVAEAFQKLKAAGKLPQTGSAPISENPEDHMDTTLPPGMDSDATPASQPGTYINARPGRGNRELPQPGGGAPNGNAPVNEPALDPSVIAGGPPPSMAPKVQGGPALAPAAPGGAASGPGGPPEVSTQKQFDELPTGATYINKRSGQQRVKPAQPLAKM